MATDVDITLKDRDLGALAEAWRLARPFAHVVIEPAFSEHALTAVREAVAREPHWPSRGEIYDLLASADPPSHPVLLSVRDALAGSASLEAIRTITGIEVRGVELRAYAYLPGNHLLPHTDWRDGVDRRVAFALYVFTDGCRGGELELFEAEMQEGAIVATRPSLRIDPHPNRLVLFEVTPASLHQVREVLAGARLSLAGWFLG